jgi:hypothetical protein
MVIESINLIISCIRHCTILMCNGEIVLRVLYILEFICLCIVRVTMNELTSRSVFKMKCLYAIWFFRNSQRPVSYMTGCLMTKSFAACIFTEDLPKQYSFI